MKKKALIGLVMALLTALAAFELIPQPLAELFGLVAQPKPAALDAGVADEAEEQSE